MSNTVTDWKTFIKAFRAASKLSQSAFAARFKINLRTLQNWECGRSRPHKFLRPVLLRKLQKIHVDIYAPCV
jgi:DNA-binding transcriptional regulator YiaG